MRQPTTRRVGWVLLASVCISLAEYLTVPAHPPATIRRRTRTQRAHTIPAHGHARVHSAHAPMLSTPISLCCVLRWPLSATTPLPLLARSGCWCRLRHLRRGRVVRSARLLPALASPRRGQAGSVRGCGTLVPSAVPSVARLPARNLRPRRARLRSRA
jgi:hypothetical protein